MGRKKKQKKDKLCMSDIVIYVVMGLFLTSIALFAILQIIAVFNTFFGG